MPLRERPWPWLLLFAWAWAGLGCRATPLRPPPPPRPFRVVVHAQTPAPPKPLAPTRPERVLQRLDRLEARIDKLTKLADQLIERRTGRRPAPESPAPAPLPEPEPEPEDVRLPEHRLKFDVIGRRRWLLLNNFPDEAFDANSEALAAMDMAEIRAELPFHRRFALTVGGAPRTDTTAHKRHDVALDQGTGFVLTRVMPGQVRSRTAARSTLAWLTTRLWGDYLALETGYYRLDLDSKVEAYPPPLVSSEVRRRIQLKTSAYGGLRLTVGEDRAGPYGRLRLGGLRHEFRMHGSERLFVNKRGVSDHRKADGFGFLSETTLGWRLPWRGAAPSAIEVSAESMAFRTRKLVGLSAGLIWRF